jgi:RHS repeat-associated protein
VGVAGAGWTIPLWHVHESTSRSQRKPLAKDGTVSERVFLNLGGTTLLMVATRHTSTPVETYRPKTYRPMVASAFLELTRHTSGASAWWTLEDISGRQYTFRRIPGLSAKSYFLAEIADSIRANRVTMTYELDFHDYCTPEARSNLGIEPEILMTELTYSHHPQTGVARHIVRLEYGTQRAIRTTSALPRGAASCVRFLGAADGRYEHTRVLSQVASDGIVQTRMRILNRVFVLSQPDEISGTPPVPLRTYDLGYEDDPDLGMPRLKSVRVLGKGEIPGTAPGLPVAAYGYGRAHTSDPLPSIVMTRTADIPLPSKRTDPQWVFDNTRERTENIPYFGQRGSATRIDKLSTDRALRDLTGDGLPDFLTRRTDATGVRIHRSLANKTGVRFASSGLASLDSNQISRKFRHRESMRVMLNPARESDFGFFVQFTNGIPSGLEISLDSGSDGKVNVLSALFTETLSDLVDFNGDGRLDRIEVSDDDPNTAANEANIWRIYLNTPGPQGGHQIVWKLIKLDVTRFRQALLEVGHARLDRWHIQLGQQPRQFFWHAFPIARTRSHQGFEFHDQWMTYTNPFGEERWKRTPRENPIEPAEGITATEWKLIDVNGDGLPDLVFHGKPFRTVEDNGCASFLYPFIRSVITDDPGPTWTPVFPSFCHVSVRSEGGGDIRVFYNTSRGSALSFAPQPQPLNAGCIENWTHELSSSKRDLTNYSHLNCGLLDANGDGLVDLFRDGVLQLGVGDRSFGGRLVLPGHSPGRFYDSEAVNRRLGGRDWIHSFQLVGLVDITGDGIPDYITAVNPEPESGCLSDDRPADNPACRGWHVYIGNGGGFHGPFRIADERFQLSHAIRGAGRGGTVEGLVDINGDGRVDLIRVDADGGTLQVSEIQFAGQPGALGAGRLTSIGNARGGWVDVEYGNAKLDARTQHQVPFAEIVATKLTTKRVGVLPNPETGAPEMELLEPVRYAFGDASMYFHPVLGRWFFAGYGTQVALILGSTSVATVTKYHRPSDANGYERYALIGSPKAAHRMEASFPNGDPRDLLGINAMESPFLRGETVSSHATRVVATEPDLDPESNECHDLPDPYGRPLQAGADRNLCRRVGYAFGKETRTWEGTKLGTPAGVRRNRSVSIDDYGRLTSIVEQGDRHLVGDELCTRITYAVPASAPRRNSIVEARVQNAPHVVLLTDCGGNDIAARTLGRTRLVYDDLPEGLVGNGLPTKQIIDRFNATTGEHLGSHERWQAIYDSVGNPLAITRTRADGVSQTESLTYDSFALVPEQTHVTASDVPGITLSIHRSYDPVSLLPESSQNANGVLFKTRFDPYGRVVARSVLDPGRSVEHPLQDWKYGDGLVRYVKTRTYHAWTLVGDVSRGFTETTQYIDELGRLVRMVVPLGSDYGGQHLVMGQTIYDSRGRPRFVADAFVETGSSPPRYGTTYHYDRAGRVTCAIRGVGLQNYTTATNESQDLYPTCYEYAYDNFQRVVRIRGPNELLRGSVEAGAFDETRMSAIGAVRSRARVKGETRLEYAEFGYDHLGSLTTVRRSTNPADARAGFVTWSFMYDSIRQLISIREAALAEQRRSYDVWGNLVEHAWTDRTGTTRAVQNAYDGFGRLVRGRHLRNGIVDPDFPAEYQYHYDRPGTEHYPFPDRHLLGRLAYVLAEVDNTQTKSYFGYDLLGRAYSEIHTFPDATTIRRFGVERTLGPSGRVERLVFLDPDTRVGVDMVSYDYDTSSRLRRVMLNDRTSLFNSTSIDSFGRYLAIDYGNSARETYQYRADRRRELTRQLLSTPTHIHDVAFVGYDGEGRLKRRDYALSEIGRWWRAHTTTYAYDATERLSRSRTETFTGLLSSVTEDQAFAYDSLGNLRSITDHVASTWNSFQGARADPDQICSHASGPIDSPLLFARFCTYQYDELGNVRRLPAPGQSARDLSYDAASRLRGMQKDLMRIDLAYGALDELREVTRQRVDTAEVLRRERGFGGLVREEWVNGSWRHERRIPGPLGIAALIRRDGTAHAMIYRHGDARGNRVFTDDDGTVVQFVDYHSYGVVSSNSGVEGSLTYTDELWNFGKTFNDFGIVLLGARPYEPATGRFLQRDPLTIPRSSGRTNPYMFSFGDPVNFADPRGDDPDPISLYQSVFGSSWGEASWEDRWHWLSKGYEQELQAEREAEIGRQYAERQAWATEAASWTLFNTFALGIPGAIEATSEYGWTGFFNTYNPFYYLLLSGHGFAEGDPISGTGNLLAAASTAAPFIRSPSPKVVTFTDRTIAGEVLKEGLVGSPSGGVWVSPLGDIRKFALERPPALAHYEIAIQTGYPPRVAAAAEAGAPIVGFVMPRWGMGFRQPTAKDARGYINYAEGGRTAIYRSGGHVLNPTRELFAPGRLSLPYGSYGLVVTPAGFSRFSLSIPFPYGLFVASGLGAAIGGYGMYVSAW